MNILFLGPRIQDIGGFGGNDFQTFIKQSIVSIIDKHLKDKSTIITDAFPGIGYWSAEYAKKVNKPYSLYVPFDDCHVKWPKHVQLQYNYLLKNANKTIQVDKGEYDYKKLVSKDQKMIEDANLIYCYYPSTTRNYITNLLDRNRKSNIEYIEADSKSDWYIEI